MRGSAGGHTHTHTQFLAFLAARSELPKAVCVENCHCASRVPPPPLPALQSRSRSLPPPAGQMVAASTGERPPAQPCARRGWRRGDRC